MVKNINSKSNKDLIIIFFVTVLVSVVLIKIDAFEIFSDFSENHEEYELDEIVLILLVLSFSTIWYAIRRYIEIKSIRNLLEANNLELNKKNIQKDELLLHQTKMASLGEMIENIAHQWRQPLSVISIGASGIKIKKEFDNLDDEELESILDNILLNTKYLSDTIENFKHFIEEDRVETLFNPNNNINQNLNIMKGSLKISDVKVILDLNSDLEIYNYPNELTQVFINIINNSIDALISNSILEKYIFISSFVIEDQLHIKIKDNAKGIPSDIINKIFEPYFTTKHKSQGTGLGLFMSYKIIDERMKGEIFVKNTTFKFKKEKFTGAQFNIILPINKESTIID